MKEILALKEELLNSKIILLSGNKISITTLSLFKNKELEFIVKRNHSNRIWEVSLIPTEESFSHIQDFRINLSKKWGVTENAIDFYDYFYQEINVFFIKQKKIDFIRENSKKLKNKKLIQLIEEKLCKPNDLMEEDVEIASHSLAMFFVEKKKSPKSEIYKIMPEILEINLKDRANEIIDFTMNKESYFFNSLYTLIINDSGIMHKGILNKSSLIIESSEVLNDSDK